MRYVLLILFVLGGIYGLHRAALWAERRARERASRGPGHPRAVEAVRDGAEDAL
jgi:hypothetical protein